MCARYTVFTEEEVIEMREIIAEVERQMFGTLTRSEIYPSDIAPVVTRGGPRPMKWGFPGVGGKGIIINARAETAAEKAMFRGAFASRRCAIPAAGFFEWGAGQSPLPPDSKKGRTKYLFTLPDCPIFYLAGIYNDAPDYPYFAVLTTGSRGSVAEIHDRMPVILRPDDRTTWLYGGAAPAELPSLVRTAV